MKTNKAKSRLGSIIIGQHTYSYTLRRSKKAKNILIHVDIDGGIEVVVPWYVAYAEAEKFLAKKHAWMERVIKKHAALRQELPRRQWRTGETLSFFGELYHLTVHIEAHRQRPFVKEQDSELMVRVSEQTDIQSVVARWYRKKSRDYFVEQSIAMATELGREVAAVRVRDTKSQWGSCNRHKKILAFGWRLALAPEPVARYVVAHEVAHLVHANHSDRFWRTVERVYPDFQQHRQWLRRYGYTLVL